ncbi:T9SS type A sorting domain-containing protein [candidate division KSB1 bacterium]|nr:T9SS type A sorting domain-containing protein [candidate division KSB1 bacterium]
MKTFAMILTGLLTLTLAVWAGHRPTSTLDDPIDKAALGDASRSASLCNALVCVQTDGDGDFNIGTAAGQSLLYFYPSGPATSDIRVSIDGLVYNIDGQQGSACDGQATYVTEVVDVSIHDYFVIGAIQVEVRHTPVLFSATTGAILTQTIVTNLDNVSHNIGVLYEYDTTVDGDDAAELYLGATHLLDETCYTAAFAADYWDAIPTSNAIVGRGTFTRFGDPNIVTPDALAFGQWGPFWGTCWNRVCTNTPYGDSAVLYQWNEVPVAPGADRMVGTYYGVGEILTSPGDLQISVSVPPLRCENYAITPNPANILISVANNGGTTCNDVTVALSDGSGSGGTASVTPASQSAGTITPGNNSAVNFSAALSYNTSGGDICFTVTVTSPTCPTYVYDFCLHVPPCDILSVEVSSFSAIAGDASVTLNWATQSETDNDHFEVMRDGALAARINGAGSSTVRHDYTWTDHGLQNGTLYHYTLVSVDFAGNRRDEATTDAIPRFAAPTAGEFALLQNFPNPFNPETSIAFDLAEAGHVTLKVYDVLGHNVATLMNDELGAGRHIANFNGASLPSGVYLYRLEANGFTANRKMVLMK